jgi:hypothetical protein
MASRGVQRTHTEKQALKQHTRKLERQRPKAEGRRRDFANEIEFNNAATGGHVDDPIPTRPNSRSAIADQRRAAEKGMGVMSLSKKIDPGVKVAGARETQDRMSARIDGTKTSRAAKSARKSLDKGSLGKTSAGPGATAGRRAKSNAEIAESVTTTARRGPAPRGVAADVEGGSIAPRTLNKRTGGARQRVPAPGNVVSAPKGEFIPTGAKATAENEYVTSSAGGRKPPKRPARAGKATGASRAKGADVGLES